MTTQNATKVELAIVPLEKILGVEPSNPRKNTGTTSDAELDRSIAKHGVLQPVLLQSHPKRKGFFSLIAGKRRFESSKRLKLEGVPAMIKDGIDAQDIGGVSMVENIQRKSLEPMDEILAIGQMMKAFEGKLTKTEATRHVAEVLGKSPSFVARRAHASNLTKKVIRKLSAKDSPFRNQGIESVLLLAQLGPEAQEDYLDRLNWKEANPSELRQRVLQTSLELSASPFALDVKTVPSLPACATCPNNSANTPGLFSELDSKSKSDGFKGVCRSLPCFETKLGAWLDETVAAARAKYGKDLVLIRGSYEPGPEPKTDLKPQHDYVFTKPAKKNAKGSRPVIHVTGKGLGTVRWVSGLPPVNKPKAVAGPGKSEAKASVESKVERLSQQRNNAFVERVREMAAKFFKNGTTGMKHSEALRISLAYGLRRNQLPDWKGRKKMLDKGYSPFAAIFAAVAPEVDAVLKPGMQNRFEDAKVVLSNVMGLEDHSIVMKEIEKELPESAALQRARAVLKAESKSKPPVKKAAKKMPTKKAVKKKKPAAKKKVKTLKAVSHG